MDKPPDPAVTCAPHFYPDHMREKLKPMLVDDEHGDDIVAQCQAPEVHPGQADPDVLTPAMLGGVRPDVTLR
ncbi:hypothetical protein KB879_34015 (plasmid) [Cupriavidus sp. KK10]|uniref:hypothetical protein n=1 Tax=Cupriavidus sp. KK10 TaxID=1478019 RepID=UPI001BAE2C70|nr:hypothetical protein [Cupriavidus sp. KK10]QUN32616.1 hypothetical protein KB879_34015 [Cupriavidus sp. KK10]